MLPFKLAIRFLKSGKGQTILIMVGIAVAIAAQVFIGLLINSLQKTLVDRTIANQPQITITSAAESPVLADWQSIVSGVQSNEQVQAVAAAASGNAFIQKGAKTSPVLLRGLNSDADAIYGISGKIYKGIWNTSADGILMGKDLQQQLNYSLGDKVTISSPQGKSSTFLITGFFDLGVQQLNSTWIVSTLNTAQSFFGYNNSVSSIEITLKDLFQADIIAGQIQASLNNPGLSITNWKAQNSSLLSGLQGQSISSLMIQIFIIVAVVIAIAAILSITVFQKSRQLGILKAMGIKDVSASLIFIYEGLIIGVIAAVVGVILGLGLFYGFILGTTKPGELALVETIIDFRFIAISWVISVAASVIAALIPARRSLRLNPIDVIREG
jgi:lipoprotein-releasing system permease protein